MLHKKGKGAVLLGALALSLTAVIGGTAAWLQDATRPVENRTLPASVTTEVSETLEGAVKKDVKLKNTGNVEAYIRAAVVVNWVDGEGNPWREAPVFGRDYRWTSGAWAQGADGYLYYLPKVAPGAETASLFTDCALADTAKIPQGCALSVEILGQAIQALGLGGAPGTPVAVLKWDSVTGIDDAGNLQVEVAG